VDEVHRELPTHPSVFLRAPDTLRGHGETVPRPVVSECLDFEGELALVIGRTGSRIEAARAMEHVAGYTCFNDISVRDWQKHSVTAGKNFADTAPCGPWLATAESVPDPEAMEVLTRLNGREVQRGRVDSMVYKLAQLVSYLSCIAPLRCGDIIATGTPAGVGSGRTPPLWMRPGDCVEVDITGIGVLRNAIVASN
jgi:2-keto-4-pentenoate hydratase/2-oxohepta-3-ene-1,7-dioic acid hydratase in catechol pathway